MGRGAGWAAGSSRVALMRLKQSAFKTTAQRGNQPEPWEGSKEMAGWVLTFPRERENRSQAALAPGSWGAQSLP